MSGIWIPSDKLCYFLFGEHLADPSMTFENPEIGKIKTS